MKNTTQHNTTQHNTTQHNTTQHNTTQHNTTQHNTTQHNLDYLGQDLFVKLFLRSSLIFEKLVDSFSVIKGGVSFD